MKTVAMNWNYNNVNIIVILPFHNGYKRFSGEGVIDICGKLKIFRPYQNLKKIVSENLFILERGIAV